MTTQLQARLSKAIIEFRDEEIEGLVQEALDAGLSANDITFGILVPALDEVGKLYSGGTYFLPELVMCGDVVNKVMGILDPLFQAQGKAGRLGRVVIGTVEGDMHDIGKNMVVTMLRGSGYEVFDLGVNVTPDTFVETVREKTADILALSALLLTTREEMRQVIDTLTEAGLRNTVKTMVGGCPVNQAFADAIGADGYGEDAPAAVRVANELVGYKGND